MEVGPGGEGERYEEGRLMVGESYKKEALGRGQGGLGCLGAGSEKIWYWSWEKSRAPGVVLPVGCCFLVELSHKHPGNVTIPSLLLSFLYGMVEVTTNSQSDAA